jgi:hypothetical protein
MLYHKQTHKWEGMIQRTIALLSPDVGRVLDERGEAAAYHVAHGENE